MLLFCRLQWDCNDAITSAFSILNVSLFTSVSFLQETTVIKRAAENSNSFLVFTITKSFISRKSFLSIA